VNEEQASDRQILGNSLDMLLSTKLGSNQRTLPSKKLPKLRKSKSIDKEIISTTLYHSAAQRQLSSLIYFRYVLIPFMIGHDSLHSSCS
jgi:hypothetical protein